VVNRVNIIPSSSLIIVYIIIIIIIYYGLITVQNLAIFSPTVCVQVGVPKNFGNVLAPPLGITGVANPEKRPLLYHAEFGHARSNHIAFWVTLKDRIHKQGIEM